MCVQGGRLVPICVCRAGGASRCACAGRKARPDVCVQCGRHIPMCVCSVGGASRCVCAGREACPDVCEKLTFPMRFPSTAKAFILEK